MSVAAAVAAASSSSSHHCHLHLSTLFDQISDICGTVQIVKLFVMHPILLLYKNILRTSRLSSSFSQFASSNSKNNVSHKHTNCKKNYYSLLLSKKKVKCTLVQALFYYLKKIKFTLVQALFCCLKKGEVHPCTGTFLLS